MIEMEQHHLLHHRHSPTTSKLNGVMNSIVLSGYTTGTDDLSLSSTASTPASLYGKNGNQADSLCNISSVGESSSVTSSIDLLYFSPTTQTSDQGISLTPNDPEPNSPTKTVANDANIDDYVLSMLNTAKELSTFSVMTDCSPSNSSSLSLTKNIQSTTKNYSRMKEKRHDIDQVNTLPRSWKKNNEATAELKEGSPNPSTLTSETSEVDSMIKELEEASSTNSNSRPQTTPKFLKMDDQYTTNNYVALVRDFTNEQVQKRNKDDALFRTSSWAANLSSNPPPLPASSVPCTPIMSRYRIMNSSMKVRPDNYYLERNDTPTSTKSLDPHGYFQHSSEPHINGMNGMQKKFNQLASKLTNIQRFKPMSLTMNHPTLENSEASLTRSGDIYDPPSSRMGTALIMRNPALLNRLDTSATLPLPSSNDYWQANNDKALTATRIDEFLDNTQDYLYDLQSADTLQAVREIALQNISSYLERSMSLRIKQWGMKLDVIRNIKNKFSKTQPSEHIIKNKLFGMPLFMIQALNGNGCPFPKFVMDIMDYLKESAINMDGIFRRCGSQRRIQEMREICDKLDCHDPLPEEMKTVTQINDLSDLFKQYLRALPQKLVPENISEVVTCAIAANPSEKHLEIMKLMVLIMPNEHRDALLVFLDFLVDISKNSNHNLMTVDNLSICTMPTVFTLSDVTQTPNRRRKTVAIMSDKDAIQYRALKEALSVLISNRSEFDMIPAEILKAASLKNIRKKKKDLKDALPPLSDMGTAASLRYFIAKLHQEYDESWKAWNVESISDNGIIFATREVDDSFALKSCRLQLTVPASPQQVLSCLLNHREKWDLVTASSHQTIIDLINKEDITYVTFNNFNKATDKRAIVARIWQDNEAGTGRAFVAEKTCKKDPNFTNVDIYHSVFLICPFNGKSIVNYISRIDLKGKSISWYEKTYRQLLISQMTRLANLLKNMSD